MEETITLQDIFKTLKKRLSLIIILTIIALAISAVVSYFVITPIYQSSTQILINQEKTEVNTFSSQDIETNLQLINTYNVIIKSPAILSLVIDELDLNTTPAALTNKITVNNAEDSQVVNITVQDPDPQRAVDIANKTAQVFQAQIKTLMQVDNVSVLTPAVLGDNPSPVKPDPMLNMAIAAVIGLMLGVGLAFLLEYLDTTVKTEEDIEELLNLPVLGLISNISEKDLQDTKLEVIDRRKRL
ncbi:MULTISPECIES: YveK family protein [Psychrobacillus]|jgi:capsular polysaccharide biosynthesis protein|uniref:Capsular biosynthesis protein n=1 Tax=Psychrobacillus faecigallinarum TaxID=2762235 RepID=A0ABR8R636_9BACI|nr:MULTISPECIES: Wzz/FepE/Etk N-terminal domain-containing protein [Psychrobacillus]MBD7943260.1 capsular biosynthesis protein [Psychrobacillus faecigallinarum]QEY20694.1 capsular biosynthesis protein [Psychrobacillus sp. AK 1817]QGM31223.1 capsular biosynthesis protein [Bacillus sp. N3536]